MMSKYDFTRRENIVKEVKKINRTYCFCKNYLIDNKEKIIKYKN